jgi:hypothetical protein
VPDTNDTILGARVLITVKAYPKPSGKYEELVCTAGLLEGSHWIRIYPVPFRFLDDQKKYPKYAWIKLDLERRSDRDFRPESYRPLKGIREEIVVLEKIPTTDRWRQRRAAILQNVYASMADLIADAYSERRVSLATLKPRRILDVRVEPCSREWPEHWISRLKQLDLFETPAGGGRRPVRKVPYDFSYVFESAEGRTHTLKIEDWELGALYWNCLARSNNNEQVAVENVRKKYLALSRTDIHLFLGTTLHYHLMHAPNPFIIIGVFYPPRDPQMSLFE